MMFVSFFDFEYKLVLSPVLLTDKLGLSVNFLLQNDRICMQAAKVLNWTVMNLVLTSVYVL